MLKEKSEHIDVIKANLKHKYLAHYRNRANWDQNGQSIKGNVSSLYGNIL